MTRFALLFLFLLLGPDPATAQLPDWYNTPRLRPPDSLFAYPPLDSLRAQPYTHDSLGYRFFHPNTSLFEPEHDPIDPGIWIRPDSTLDLRTPVIIPPPVDTDMVKRPSALKERRH